MGKLVSLEILTKKPSTSISGGSSRGLGLQYLMVQGHGDIMPALILGAVIAAAFFDGVPVGPLITSGMLALGIKIFHK